MGVFRIIVTARKARNFPHIVTAFQSRGLVGLVGHFGGGGDYCLQGWSRWRGRREVPGGKLWVVIRASGRGLELSMVSALPKVSFSKSWFPARLFTGEIKASLKAAVGVDIVLQCIQMNPVRVIRNTAGIFIKGGIIRA